MSQVPKCQRKLERDIWRLPCQLPCSKLGQLEPFAQDHIQSGSEYLQGWAPQSLCERLLLVFWCISCSSQFCTFCKLAEGVLCPIIQVIDEDIKECYLWCGPLAHTSRDLPPAGVFAADHNPSSLAVQAVFSPSHCSLT